MRPTTLLLLIAGIVHVTGSPARAAELQVVSLSPARHATAPANTAVTVNFDRALLTTSITPSTFRVFAHFSGAIPGTYSFSNGTQSVTFTPSRNFSAGEVVYVNLSRDVTAADASALRSAGFAADMNNDGIYDLVVGAQGSQQVIVLLGNGDGTFTTMPARMPAGSSGSSSPATSPATATWTSRPANGDSDSGSILLGNGDGTLGLAQVVPAASHVVGSVLGDLDGDGDPDWVLSSFGGGRWRVFTNDGTGTFSFDQQILAPSNPSCAILTDIDNDGDLDLTDEIADVVVLMRNAAGGGYG